VRFFTLVSEIETGVGVRNALLPAVVISFGNEQLRLFLEKRPVSQWASLNVTPELLESVRNF
jgi:hypothetical protein